MRSSTATNPRTKRNHIANITAIVAMIGIAGNLVIGCSGPDRTDKTAQVENQTTQKSDTVQYTCPMHPEVVQDKPGDCPKCGMKLVEK